MDEVLAKSLRGDFAAGSGFDSSSSEEGDAEPDDLDEVFHATQKSRSAPFRGRQQSSRYNSTQQYQQQQQRHYQEHLRDGESRLNESNDEDEDEDEEGRVVDLDAFDEDSDNSDGGQQQQQKQYSEIYNRYDPFAAQSTHLSSLQTEESIESLSPGQSQWRAVQANNSAMSNFEAAENFAATPSDSSPCILTPQAMRPSSLKPVAVSSEAKGEELSQCSAKGKRRVSFADDHILEDNRSLTSSLSSVQSLEDDEDEHGSDIDSLTEQSHGVFEIGREPLQGSDPNGQRRYRRISMDSLRTSELTYNARVTLYRDRAYAGGFIVMIIGVILFGFATYRVENKHHYIATLVVGLCLTGIASSLMVGFHYKLFRDSWQSGSPFSLKYLRFVAPVQGVLLIAVLLVIWAKGWSWVVGLVVCWNAIYDFWSLTRTEDGTQFAAVLLEMASNLVVDNEEMRPAVRRTWFIFLAFNVWLIVWISIFVDTASSPAYHSKVALCFLMFGLYWSTQVARSLLSYYVTGVVSYRLVLASRDGRQPGLVQAMLLKRSLSAGFGSVCAGALYIHVAIVLSALQNSLRFLCRCGRFENSRSRTVSHASAEEDLSTQQPHEMIAEESTRAAIHGGPMFHANRYAWARVSLRGARFRPASQEAWSKLVSTGVIGAVQQETADQLLNGWIIIFGCLTALIANLLLPNITQQTSEIQFEFFMASFGAGSGSASLLLEPLRASIAAIFISFAENPKCFAKEWPIVHHRLMRTSEMTLFSTSAFAAHLELDENLSSSSSSSSSASPSSQSSFPGTIARIESSIDPMESV
mmetsp:Transcript_7246/g.14487  ORF Transcript_7246/g.14487 Transcript_7246/m.14487 type:complete len:809 (+) Transcript_7246:580-3006(+)|eukprot:CAMPEP_0171568476 /NCGR_PEP_ID=MMETSP0961-20121227/1785_1 /TAXON_ID=87120 /ORGANISM="Aurantiochytrium limacinum, Strain ATCCMYA-1381" /LENGTH=808 /DNA_ID=CAMNT_0012122609 /DNA_START=508 /DNA_END=2934 /DNA_ORIENTATION=-